MVQGFADGVDSTLHPAMPMRCLRVDSEDEDRKPRALFFGHTQTSSCLSTDCSVKLLYRDRAEYLRVGPVWFDVMCVVAPAGEEDWSKPVGTEMELAPHAKSGNLPAIMGCVHPVTKRNVSSRLWVHGCAPGLCGC